jgi:hypothetical protein
MQENDFHWGGRVSGDGGTETWSRMEGHDDPAQLTARFTEVMRKAVNAFGLRALGPLVWMTPGNGALNPADSLSDSTLGPF